MLVCNNILLFEDFSVLANGINDFKINLQEMFFDALLLATVKQSISVTPFYVILLRHILFVASRHCIVLQSPLISYYGDFSSS